MRTNAMSKSGLILLLVGCTLSAMAQTKYWTGASGAWNDAAHWSLSPNGPGGAGAPRAQEDVVVQVAGEVVITIADGARCRDLRVVASEGFVRVDGSDRSTLEVSGDLALVGSVHWALQGTLRMTGNDDDLIVDTRGIPLSGAVVFDGRGTWQLLSDLVLGTGDVTLRGGVVKASSAMVKARTLCVEGARPKQFDGGRGVVMLSRTPEQAALRAMNAAAGTTLTVANVPLQVGSGDVQESDRDINVCGTGPGQTPFVVDAQLTSNYNGFGVSCRGECNGTVTVSVTGGVGPFTYSWLFGGPNTATWTAACGGPQIVVVTDVGQGISCPAQVNVTEPAPLGVIFFGQGTPPTCADVCNGTRTALAIGGVSPYDYDWNNGAGNGSSFFQLCAGNNTLEITDANGCIFDTTFFFNLQPISPNLTFSNTACFGACDGEASVAPAGGTPPFTITWTPVPPNGQGGTSATGLCAGSYSVTLADANGCDTTLAFIIEEPPPIIPNPAFTNASCFGNCDGSASVSPSGSAGPFGYAWAPEPGAGQNTSTATGLCAGVYTVLITDQASGCDTLISFTIQSPPAIQVNGTVVDASCSNTCDGSIGIVVLGGTSPYVITWSPQPPVGQGTTSISGLCPGIWQVNVADAAGCDTTVSFTVNAPPPLDVQLTTTDLTCAGVCDGTATAAVSGGVAPYTFVWTPAPGAGQGTANATLLCAGNYSVLIADANGCDTTLSFIIAEPPPLQATPAQTEVSCGGLCDGTASVAVTGGTAPYTYLWSPQPGSGQGTADASQLCAGAYSVLITDANGCTLSVPFTILDAVPITLSLQVTAATCPGVCDGTAGVIAGGGQAPYTYLWSPAPGAGQGSPNVSGLCPQAYSLTVTDAVGCDTTIAFTVPAPPLITVNAVVTDATCAGECDGSIAVTASGGVGGFTYVWSPQPGSGQGTANAANLCPGSWQVTITSGACDTTISYLIEAPPPLLASVVNTPPTCAGACDGEATVTASGGTAPYSFLWTPEPGAGQGTATATGLCAGSYTVVVSDAVGCDTTLTFELLDAPPIVVDLLLTPASCGGACDGTAIATVSGGTAPYTYLWEPGAIVGQGTASATALCPGAYTFTVTDAQGCSLITPFTISTPSGIDAQGTAVDPSCGNVCDGTIDLITTGGLAPYTYVWSPEPGAGQGTPNVSGLCAGLWTVQITDAAACDTLLQFTLTAPSEIIPDLVLTNETCNGPCDGTATVTPTGGQAPYTYVWIPEPPAGQGTPAATGLCPGPWSVIISDAAGCDTTVAFTIIEQQPIIADLVAVDGLCAGVCDGSASVSPSGGIAPYTFNWVPQPGAGQGTDAVTGLCVGAWQVTVTDAVGCDTTIAFVINAPPFIQASLAVTPETCDGPCTGTASLTASGGTGAPAVLWQPEPGTGQGTFTAGGLCAGTSYTVTLTDQNGCDTTLAFTVDPFTAIIPNSSSTPTSCAGSCDGTATVGPTGGLAPYTYVWSPEPATGQGTPSVTGLCAGAATVSITDANGCTVDVLILILEPPALDAAATVNDVSCAGLCDGSIVLNTQGGTAPYTYAWSPVPPNGQGTNSALDLCAGPWSVIITDANGCSVPFGFTIQEPPTLTVDIVSTPSQCQVCIGTISATISGGTPLYTTAWTDAGGNPLGSALDLTDLCAGVYTLSVTDANGCTLSQAVPITDSDGEVLTMTDGTTSCPNVCDGTVSVAFTCNDPACTIAWVDAFGNDLGQSGTTLSGLCPGLYLAVITNGSGCISVDTATVVAPPPTDLTITSSPASCAGACDGTATVGISGGTAPYVFTWVPQPGNGQGTPFVSGLCAGLYTVTITDGGACDTTAQVLITEPPALALAADVNDPGCAGACDGSIVLSPSGGSAPYTFLWTPAPPSGQGGSAAFGLCAGVYEVIVSDANGCSVAQQFTLVEASPLELVGASTASTCPNCDGTAEVFISGGAAPFDITWTLGGAPVGNTAAITDLCGGLYLASVTDGNGCTATVSVTVPDSNAEVLVTQDGQTTCGNTCDGSVGVTFTCTTPACAVLWTDDQGNTIAENQLTVAGLCVGVYTVQVTNGAGCVSFATATVSPSQTIVPNLSSTPASCPGACDATATVGPSGGVEPYTYTWDPAPPTGQGTPQAEGLCAGVYSVTILDATGCDTTVQVLILEPPPVVLDGIQQDASCAGTCNGSIEATLSGGTAPYVISWDPAPPVGQGTLSVAGLCAGAYTLTATDANGCVSTRTWTIVEPPALDVQGSSTQSTCGICDGTASIVISGGTAPYAVIWTLAGNIVGTGPSLTGRCAGIYVAQVIDAQLCEQSVVVPISDVDAEQITTVDDVTTCPGDCDGEVNVIFTCSNAPCTIVWFDSAGNDLGGSSGQLGGLCAGTYFVQVTNGSGCIAIDTAVVAEPDPVIPNLSTTPASCAGVCDATATVGPTGGQAPYTYLWAPEPLIGQGTPQAQGLCAGSYQVTITDAVGCELVVSALILEPPPVTATATVTPVSCNGSCDGAISLVPAGGVAPYILVWNPEPPNGQGGTDATGLCAGTWEVLISDANGCDTTLTFVLVDPPVLVVDLSATDNLCFGDCNGTAQLNITGGVAPYASTWSDPNGNTIAQDVDSVLDLCAGNYSVVVVDANGCAITLPFTINEATAVDAGLLVTNETCFGPCDGTAAVSPSGGTGPYTIFWQPEPLTGQGTEQVTGLCTGNYTVLITDALGCDTTYAFTVLPYAPIADNATITNVLCNGSCDATIALNPSGGIGSFAYSWTPEPAAGQGTASISGLCPGIWTVLVTDGAGCDSTFAYTISEPPALVIAVDQVTPSSCATANDGAISVSVSGGVPAYGFNWTGPGVVDPTLEDLNALSPGSYTLVVTDANGCTATVQVDVDALVTVDADAGVDQQLCAGGPIVLDGSSSVGAVTYQWMDDQGNSVGTTPVVQIPDLAAGTYTFTLTVTDGPCVDNDVVQIEVLQLPDADAGPDQTIFLSGTATLGGAPTGPPGSSFSWSPDSLLSSGTAPDPVADPPSTTWFVVTVTGPNGCISIDSVLITVVPEVVIPSGFTPNADGRNDTWIIDFIELFPDCEVEVYSRWGEMLFRSVGYRTPWDGRYKDGAVPVGTYYYVVKLNDPQFPEPFTGPLTVIR